ncbi:phospholipase [Babesia ovata]|uniref:Phospholipase n=1 Tax=Babesia ovata TaxID=189622 RepID=A0A2H6KHW3_9APIC|nr:phospholipase [Babesia ovata]GBE62580.1 phospholipase [Babesia ovata]
MVHKSSRKRASSSLYDRLYTRHLDCADHLCSGESSNVDTDSGNDEVYESAFSATESSPSDSPQRSPDESDRSESIPAAEQKPAPTRERVSRISPPSSGDEASMDVDPFSKDAFGDSSKKGRSNWKKSLINAFTAYAKAAKTAAFRTDSTQEKEPEPEEVDDVWTDFMNPKDGSKRDKNTITGTVDGTDSEHVPLQKRGFYTIFLRNTKVAEKKKKDQYLYKVKFTYKVIDCNRRREEVRVRGNVPSGSGASTSFIAHDIFGDDGFGLTNEGSVSVSSTIKIILVYASEDTIAQFSISHKLLNTNPSVQYKIVYGGWCSAVPLSITPKLGLRILSIDSCENLGTTALEALYAIEMRISAIRREKCNISDFFDVICATGSGALLALCLLKGYSARELKLQWQSIISQLFKWPHSLTYGLMFDHAHGSDYVKSWIEILGTDFMCSRPKPLCMLTSTHIKPQAHELFMFRNYANMHGPYAKTALAPMWLAGWATTALPTYIKGPSHSYLREIGCKIEREAQFADGKFISLNPSLVALHEVSDLYGYTLRTLIDENVEIFLSIGTARKDCSQAKMRDPATWQIVLNSGTSSDKIEQSHMTQLFEEHPERYHRLEMPYVRGCKHGKTDKEAVDTTFTAAMDAIQSSLLRTVDAIAQTVSK